MIDLRFAFLNLLRNYAAFFFRSLNAIQSFLRLCIAIHIHTTVELANYCRLCGSRSQMLDGRVHNGQPQKTFYSFCNIFSCTDAIHTFCIKEEVCRQILGEDVVDDILNLNGFY